MVQINFALKEVNCKVVYYGPGKSGKTTNLEMVHKNAPAGHRGDLTSIATEGDRTLFFDFMPLDLGTIAGMKTKFQLYTVPGQVYYNSTRKLVLQGTDGVIFVADSTPGKMDENIESLKNLEENLAEYGKKLSEVPFVLQWNKRDVENPMSHEEMNEALNWHNVPTFEAVAFTGDGVFPTLKALSQLVLKSLDKGKKAGPGSAPAPASSDASAPPPPPPPPPSAPPPPPPPPPSAPADKPAEAAAAAPPPPPPPPAPAKPQAKVEIKEGGGKGILTVVLIVVLLGIGAFIANSMGWLSGGAGDGGDGGDKSSEEGGK
ncbi:MAG: GTP-binding protein [Planctomycetota bacterium]|jgi:signal recognition particle receptor subunit beta